MICVFHKNIQKLETNLKNTFDTFSMMTNHLKNNIEIISGIDSSVTDKKQKQFSSYKQLAFNSTVFSQISSK